MRQVWDEIDASGGCYMQGHYPSSKPDEMITFVMSTAAIDDQQQSSTLALRRALKKLKRARR
jgi:hypothetical protein